MTNGHSKAEVLKRRSHLSDPIRTSTSPYPVLHAYLDGYVGRSEARHELEKTQDGQGFLWAGELALEEACACLDFDRGQKLYEKARALFRKAEARSYLGGRFPHVVRARAQIRDAFSPFLIDIGQSGRLPSTGQGTESLYRRILNSGTILSETFFDKSGQYDREKEDIKGATSELAFLALSLRDANINLGCETCFPFPATLSIDRHRTGGSAEAGHGWDAGIYTRVDDQFPDLTYRVQVKTSKGRRDGYSYAQEGIPVIHISPDLELYEHEKNVGFHILQECQQELEHTSPSAPQHLADRTAKYAECLDQEQVA